jgi:hypothetical protein
VLKLTDDELDTVFRGARPIAPHLRDAYLQAVAAALKGQNIGPGSVYKAVRDVQRRFFDPPVTEPNGNGHGRPRGPRQVSVTP